MRAPFACVLSLSLALTACSGSPPQKELDRAQGAIDAARAAGAETYATEAYRAATSLLQQAHDAVTQSDYRLALTRALDAHDRAQEAARGAADGKAHARSEAEAAMTAATAAVQRLHTRITAEAARVPKNAMPGLKKYATSADETLQKARAALNTGGYLDARDSARALTREVNDRLTALDLTSLPKASRRRR